MEPSCDEKERKDPEECQLFLGEGGRRDDADPLPQLGLGCSKVSAGSLSEIKSNLGELAVSNLVHRSPLRERMAGHKII